MHQRRDVGVARGGLGAEANRVGGVAGVAGVAAWRRGGVAIFIPHGP